MADPRFYTRQGPFTLADVARLSATTFEEDAGERSFVDVGSLGEAGPDQVSFLDNLRYRDLASTTRAGACIVKPLLADLLPPGTIRLLSPDPDRAYARLSHAFYPDATPGGDFSLAPPSIHPHAHVAPDAVIGAGCRVGPGAVIESAAEIGTGCVIGPAAVIGHAVRLGDGCHIGAGATLSYCLIGERVIVHAGVRIGQDGFGFAMGAEHVKVPQLGRVLIDDDVEIGANTTIDRGSGGDTIIGRGTKIDNLVMIAHNVEIGPHCIIVAQVGIAGSGKVGAHCVLAAQVGVMGHLTIGPGVQLAARAAVIHDLPGNASYGGAPALPINEWRRQIAALKRLGRRKVERE